MRGFPIKPVLECLYRVVLGNDIRFGALCKNQARKLVKINSISLPTKY